jgi:hypothetical protein
MFIVCVQVDEGRIDVLLRVRADIPEANAGASVVITLPVPRATTSVKCVLPDTAKGNQNSPVLCLCVSCRGFSCFSLLCFSCLCFALLCFVFLCFFCFVFSFLISHFLIFISLAGQTCEYVDSEKCVLWAIKKFPGQSEQQLRVRLSVTTTTTTFCCCCRVVLLVIVCCVVWCCFRSHLVDVVLCC